MLWLLRDLAMNDEELQPCLQRDKAGVVHATPLLVHFLNDVCATATASTFASFGAAFLPKWSFIKFKILTVPLLPRSRLGMEERLANANVCELQEKELVAHRGANVQACVSGRTNKEAPCPGMIPKMMKCLA